jgi:hypothetical protein
MKIYITKILPQTLVNKIDKLIELFGEPEQKIKYELCSKDFGIHILEEETIYRMEAVFQPDFELIKNYNNFDLLVDKTNYILIPTISQVPVNYIFTPYTELKFKINKKSNLSFIIEVIEEIEHFEKKIIPINFYFNYAEDKLDLNDPFFQDNFNGFLSHLN